MLLTSPAYLAFLVALFLLFWLLRPLPRAPFLLIIAANCSFYASWDWSYLALVPVCSLADYQIARILAGTSHRLLRRLALCLSLFLNLGLLLSTKAASGVLPLSLSFYAFQALTYTIDVYRGDTEPCSSLLEYLASVSFFPTILAGPITRVGSLAPQWNKLAATLADTDGGRALFLIGLGAAKKFLIADYLAGNLVNRVFDTPRLYSGAENLIAVYGYAFQLYYDFSGYTDIAIGSALLLGIRLPPNFNRPYEALNVADFWRRWHITFSNWLRDYLFFSLPGPRHKVLPYLNLVITMVLGGLWHGLSLGFVVWGLLHGVGQAAARFWQTIRGKRPQPPRLTRLLCRLATFHFVCLGWIFFRAESVPTAIEILEQIASLTAGFANLSVGFALTLALAILAHYLPANCYAITQRRFVQAPALAQAALLAALLLGIRYLAATGAAPFVYQRF